MEDELNEEAMAKDLEKAVRKAIKKIAKDVGLTAADGDAILADLEDDTSAFVDDVIEVIVAYWEEEAEAA